VGRDECHRSHAVLSIEQRRTTDQTSISLDGNITVAPYGKYILPATTLETSLGSINKKFGAIWTGDLFAETLVAIDAIGTVGNHWLIGTTNILDEDISSSATTIITRYNSFLNNEFVLLQAFGKSEIIKITSGATAFNKISNPSFETNNTTGWDVSASDVLTNSTAKSYKGERRCC
jgi:hypothetical protein